MIDRMRLPKVRFGAPEASVAASLCLLGALGLVLSARPPARARGAGPPPVLLAAYATDLGARTANQRYNAKRAAAVLDGAVIGPGQTFSFNRRVRGWSADRGFLKAPVSYDGVLVDDYGGGVCQTSTVVYNAALLAGLPIEERHPHTFAPSYVPPGRDAAVAYAGVDLRFRNPFPAPLRLRVRAEGHLLVCRVEGEVAREERVVVRSARMDRFAPPPAPVRPGAGVPLSRWHRAGRDGVRVAVYREFYTGQRCTRRESVSDDTYRPIARAEWVSRQ